jgi:hypothetical protein
MRNKEQRNGNGEKEQMHEDRGSNPKERHPFPLMSKGER